MKSLYSIVGMKHRGAVALVASLPVGEHLTLVREPTNAIDPWAVQVWARGMHVAFIKAAEVKPLAQQMDKSGKSAVARLVIDGGKWPMAEVEA